jgi:hypothetical protein
MSYPVTTKPKGNILLGAVVMAVGSFVLSLIPFGTLIIGIIGGKIAGSVGRAITAALFPVFIYIGLIVVLSIFHGPAGLFLSILGGIGILAAAILNGLGLLIGAIIGGLL